MMVLRMAKKMVETKECYLEIVMDLTMVGVMATS
jgi:hypothetical protein